MESGLRGAALEGGALPIGIGASPNSGSSSDMFLYDDSSMSDGSLYASDQENHSTPRKRYLLTYYIIILTCYFCVHI